MASHGQVSGLSVAPASGSSRLVSPDLGGLVPKLAPSNLSPTCTTFVTVLIQTQRMYRWSTPRFVALMLLASVPALSACDPYGPAAQGTAAVDIEVRTNGAVRMQVHLPAGFAGDRKQVGEEAAHAVFPGPSTTRVTLDHNAGSPFPIIDIAAAYRPGHHVVLTIDTSALVSVLTDTGIPLVDVTVCGPFVPLTITATPGADAVDRMCGTWKGVRAAPPRVTIDMRPSSLRWWAEISLIVIACAGNLAALVLLAGKSPTTSRRIVAGSLGGAALLLCGVGIASAAAAQADNLGVLGELSGAPLVVAGAVGLLVLPLALAAITLMIVAVVRRPASGQPAAEPRSSPPSQTR